MKVAISATAPSLDADVDPRFGRCQYFIIIDPETMEFEALENSNAMAAGGAGISTAQMIAGKGVQLILTGNCGPKAYQTLSPAGVQVITGVVGRIRDAVEAYKAGKLQASAEPSVDAHFGMGGGMGMGRGMGRRGVMGPGMQPMSPPQPGFPPQQQMTKEQELQMLKDQAEAIKQELDQIASRIEDLEKE